MNERTHLDLFSGIGGFALACRIVSERTGVAIRTVGFCEIDPFCQRVLAKNFGAVAHAKGQRRQQGRSQQPASPDRPWIHGDIRQLSGRSFGGLWLVSGGFPCQPFSQAGKRRGREDDRHLWPEMLRVISESRPAWVIGENVAGIIQMELDQCIFDLAAIGYTARPLVIPACAVDAKHRRDRVWIVAHNDSRFGGASGSLEEEAESADVSFDGGSQSYAADTHQPRLAQWQGEPGNDGTQLATALRGNRWPVEPDVGRVAHGVSRRVDRLRGLGNAIVPQVAAEIIEAMIASE